MTEKRRFFRGRLRLEAVERFQHGEEKAAIAHDLHQLQYRPDILDGCLTGTSHHDGTTPLNASNR
ncbi:hypothetical protein [Streptomyces qinglanensis]|uniref:hypothetical protein n=1 Tax=Streptomyces qinglanensis TaxID=943816 RepID=UPI003D751004